MPSVNNLKSRLLQLRNILKAIDKKGTTMNKVKSRTTLAIIFMTLTAIAIAEEPALEAKVKFFTKPCLQARKELSSLKLTDEQKPKVAEALVNWRSDIQASQDEFTASRKELFSSIVTPSTTFNESEIRSSYDSYSALKEERIIRDGQLMHELQGILDDTQYKKVVDASVDLFYCSRSPVKVFTAIFGKWVKDNSTK